MDEIGDEIDEKHIMKALKIEIITLDQPRIVIKIIKSLSHDIIHGEVITIFHHATVCTDDYVVRCLYDMIKINET